MKLKTSERGDFQRYIIERLTEDNGYIERSASADWDADYAMDRGMLFKFLNDTQPDEMAELRKVYGDRLEQTLVATINTQAAKNGCSMIETLKDGITISNVRLSLLYGKPASSFNPDLSRKYDCNILSVMEEVCASEKERVDLVIFLNGIAIIAIELKYNLSGQSWRDAVRQFRKDRNPKTRLFLFRQGVFVSFAIDTQEVYMTTKLDGDATVFRPFNRGVLLSGGVVATAGNPVIEGDYSVSYMWDEVLTKDSVIELITRFIFMERRKTLDEKTNKLCNKEGVIFPRFHQIDVIRRLLADVRENRASQNYLIQHSAGSGKTYSIAWLAHRLAAVYDNDDKAVYDTVIITTDRIVVDRQLQQAIMSVDHKLGLVKVLDAGCSSADLASALSGNTKIIVTTIQKFNYVLENVRNLSEKRFAVIIDEAHSSTSGSNMISVAKALGSSGDGEEHDYEDTIVEEIRKHGKQKNVSVFAFTATPKATTLELFGRKNEHGQNVPFHLYSMQQAIEEGYILDVLSNYIEYQTYYKLNKSIEEDPEFKTREAKRQIARFVTLHPTNIAQRVEVIVEHFRTSVIHELGGKAKAMIVTSSREEAVRYHQEVLRYVQRKGYDNINALVAFTGTVELNEDGVKREYTESGINGFAEEQLPDKFDKEPYNVLLVANKYQTGFDQPKLCAMYVMKTLKGVAAVQTLSRLNRICKPYDKKTFILDFVNTAEDIKKAFSKYYTVTMLSSSVNPRDIYDIDERINAYNVIDPSHIDALNELLYIRNPNLKQKRQIDFYLSAARTRFLQFELAIQHEFKMEVHKFIRYYEFLIQATCFADPELHKKYNFLRFLYSYLEIDGAGEGFTLEGKIEASEFEQRKTKEVTKTTIISNPIINLPTADKFGSIEEQKEKLSEIIEQINARNNSKFDIGVASMHVYQILELLLKSPELKQKALSNTEEDFALAYYDSIDQPAMDNREQNKAFSDLLLTDEDQKREIFGLYLPTIWHMLRENSNK